MLNIGFSIPYIPMKHPHTDKESIIPSTVFFPHSYIQITCIECLHNSASHILGATDNSEQARDMVPAPRDLWASREIVNQH